MRRFLLISIPLLAAAVGSCSWLLFERGAAADTAALARYGILRTGSLPLSLTLGAWVLEALALTALFLLIQGRSGSRWLDGLLTGWIAWIFRAPLPLLTLLTVTRLPREPWWPWSVRWLALYTLCGLVLAGLAGRLEAR